MKLEGHHSPHWSTELNLSIRNSVHPCVSLHFLILAEPITSSVDEGLLLSRGGNQSQSTEGTEVQKPIQGVQMKNIYLRK